MQQQQLRMNNIPSKLVLIYGPALFSPKCWSGFILFPKMISWKLCGRMWHLPQHHSEDEAQGKSQSVFTLLKNPAGEDETDLFKVQCDAKEALRLDEPTMWPFSETERKISNSQDDWDAEGPTF